MNIESKVAVIPSHLIAPIITATSQNVEAELIGEQIVLLRV